MLVVARKVGQAILLGDDIEVTVVAVRGDQVRLAIKAPRSVAIQRRDAIEQVQQDNMSALGAADSVLRLMGAATSEAPRPPAPPRVVVRQKNP